MRTRAHPQTRVPLALGPGWTFAFRVTPTCNRLHSNPSQFTHPREPGNGSGLEWGVPCGCSHDTGPMANTIAIGESLTTAIVATSSCIIVMHHQYRRMASVHARDTPLA